MYYIIIVRDPDTKEVQSTLITTDQEHANDSKEIGSEVIETAYLSLDFN